MPITRSSRQDNAKKANLPGPQTVPRAYAGQWIGWSADGRRIISVGESFEECEQAAIQAGFSADQVAIERVPETRERVSGSTL